MINHMGIRNVFKRTEKEFSFPDNPDCQNLITMAKSMNNHREKCMKEPQNQKLKMECNLIENFLKMIE